MYSCTLYPVPYSLVPCTLYPVPYTKTLYPLPCTLYQILKAPSSSGQSGQSNQWFLAYATDEVALLPPNTYECGIACIVFGFGMMPEQLGINIEDHLGVWPPELVCIPSNLNLIYLSFNLH